MASLPIETPLGKTNYVCPSSNLRSSSDTEIARHLCARFEEKNVEVVYSEGSFWAYVSQVWELIEPHQLRNFTFHYDGIWPDKGGRQIRISDSKANSIVNIFRDLRHKSDFFAEAQSGINCLDGFISFGADGSPKIEAHHPDHGQRHLIKAHWQPGATCTGGEAPLLHTLLDGCFKGDLDADSKKMLIQELVGAAATGLATQLTSPKAIIFVGETAENGKSQCLSLIRALLPDEAKSAVPLSKLRDDKYLAQICGKLLNTSDELNSARDIEADTFKALVTGEPISARRVYEDVIHFRPKALHVFATNDLPPFRGGMDRGVQRRLLVLPFNRQIPEEERIPDIAGKIREEEADALLAFAIEGASRLIRNQKFTVPNSSEAALKAWIYSGDPVLHFLEKEVIEVTGTQPPRIPSQIVYEEFRKWADQEGYTKSQIPNIQPFVRRIKLLSKTIQGSRTADKRFLEGLALKSMMPGHEHRPEPRSDHLDMAL